MSIASTNNNGNGYAGLDFNQSGGYVPPDTCGAAGPSSYVETVNQTLAIYSPKATGATATTAALSTLLVHHRRPGPRRQRLGPVRPDRDL